jgi:hypothetical protein
MDYSETDWATVEEITAYHLTRGQLIDVLVEHGINRETIKNWIAADLRTLYTVIVKNCGFCNGGN